MKELITAYGMDVVQAYMKYIQENAELAVREMLKEIASQPKVGPILSPSTITSYSSHLITHTLYTKCSLYMM